MNNSTKILIIRVKQLIIALCVALTFIVIGIIIYLTILNSHTDSEKNSKYVAGVYSTSIILNGNPVDVKTTVDLDNINNIELVNVSDSVTTMYPLIQNTFDSIKDTVIENGGVEGITYLTENKYTSTLILNAIDNCLKKAKRK